MEDWVLIENNSGAPVSMGCYCLCDEDRANKLQFPDDVIVQPGHFLKVGTQLRLALSAGSRSCGSPGGQLAHESA